MGVTLGTATVEDANQELAALGAAAADERLEAPSVASEGTSVRKANELVLASWHLQVDEGSLQDGEPYLAGTARVSVARVSPATAAKAKLSGVVSITGVRRSSIDLPLVVTDGMADGVIWVPAKSQNSWVADQLGVAPGATVVVKGASA